MKKLIIIERSIDYVRKVKKVFASGNQFYCADQSHTALLRICQTDPDVIILGTNLGDANIFSFMKQIISISPSSAVVVVEKDYNTKRGSKFKSEGAYDYIRKSDDLESLILTVKEVLNKKEEYHISKNRKILNEIIGSSKAASSLKYNILNFAQNNLPILIMGESGTGKDLAASCIHRLSKRFDHRYIHLNCGAIPSTLLESELFGVEEGAFTDAKKIPGKFEQASGGTIFLNEIGELPKAAQVKILKILESKNVTRIGGQVERPIDTRIITATNKNLKKAVKEKSFREDLLYRINTLYIEIAPLRKRKDDIQILARQFLEDEENPKQLTINALEKLCEYDWPGNIRELKNVMDRAKIISIDESIRSTDIKFF